MTQMDLTIFDDDLAVDITYNGSPIRAFVTLGGGQNQVTVKSSDVPEPTPRDVVIVSGVTHYVKGPADVATNGEIQILDLMGLPSQKGRGRNRDGF